jgi:CubicO group peptidase (beta-lactamase class C family)
MDIDARKIAASIDEFLSRLTPFGFSGAALLAHGDEVLLEKGYGLADRANGIPNTPETVFCLGSVTKIFTAVAVMKLVEAGALSLESRLGELIDGIPQDKAGITLQHLLTHSAGLVNYTGEDYAPDGVEHMLEKVFHTPLAFEPGSQYAYSNAGFSLLAAIIEGAAGKPYEDYLYEQLLGPAGMEATGYVRPDWSGRTIARWYTGPADHGHALEKPYPYWNILGNGEMLSTLGDMYRWHRALLSGNLLDRATQDRMHQAYLREQGLGWRVAETDYGLLVEHNGASDLGASALFRRYLDADLVLVLFCNQAYGDLPMVVPLQDKLERILAGEEIELPSADVPQPPQADMDELAGTYGLPGGGQFRAEPAGTHLLLTAEGQAAINRLAFPDLPADAHDALNRKHEQVFRAFLDGDKEPLEDFMANAAKRMDGVSRMLKVGLAEAQEGYGAMTDLRVAGTVPSSFAPGALDTIISLTFERGSAGFLSINRDGQNIGIAFLEVAQPWALPCVPFAGGLVGYHLPLEITIEIAVERDESGRVIGLAGGKRATQ